MIEQCLNIKLRGIKEDSREKTKCAFTLRLSILLRLGRKGKKEDKRDDEADAKMLKG